MSWPFGKSRKLGGLEDFQSAMELLNETASRARDNSYLFQDGDAGIYRLKRELQYLYAEAKALAPNAYYAGLADSVYNSVQDEVRDRLKLQNQYVQMRARVSRRMR